MSDHAGTEEQVDKLEQLRKELDLKELQVNRLLNITQAINNNVNAQKLYEMYRSFLSWELGVRKMALYIRSKGKWTCQTSLGISEEQSQIDISHLLPQFAELGNLDEQEHPLIKAFDLVIPVRHKSTPIAYVFIGGFEEDDDMYSKVQFITTITNIVAVAIENKRLFRRQLEQERLKREIELAAEVQQMLVPRILPMTREYEFDYIYKPQLSVGGDYFDFIEFEDDKIVFCVGDFTGKGLAAAMLMANFQANFHTLIKQRTDLVEFVHQLNESVNWLTAGDRFITFFIAEYDVNNRILRYVNAGHNPPILLNKDELFELKKGSIMLGSYENLPKVEVGQVQIDKEALILSFTDGLTELRNEDGVMLTEETLQGFMRQHWQMHAADFNAELTKFINQFKGKARYLDDFTVLTCKLYCPGARENFTERPFAKR
ncbi:MAG TPA: SpoIIE family protein phosphatase [Saprospiraceae bacterium]|nr:SpoIIE family protein phosphatase [Saprospiraceae bacterium]